MLLHLPVAMAAAALFGAPAVARPEVSLCAKRASSAADPTLQQWCRSDTAALLEAAQCGGRVTLDLCDEASIGDLAQEWASGSVAAAASQPVAVLRNVKAPLGRIALCVADGAGTIDRPELRILLVHGLLRLLDYDPSDESRAAGSIAAPGGDGEVREMAMAERLLLRRLGWQGHDLMCSARAPHGSASGFKRVAWGLVARQAPPEAWWLHDLHSHEGRRWRAAATKRFWRTCGEVGACRDAST